MNASLSSVPGSAPPASGGPNQSAVNADAERRRRPQMPYSDRPLIEIHGDLEAVRGQMLEISTIMKERTAGQVAASSLRFLLPCSSGTVSCQAAATDLENQSLDHNLYWNVEQSDVQLVADIRATSPLYILDRSTNSEEVLRSSNCPPHILRRAIRYAASQGCSLIWVDQECIHQQDRNDKENGIQSMDSVFANSLFPVGILRTRIETQEHLDAVAMFVSNQMQRFGELLMSGGLAQAPWDTSSDPLLREIPWTVDQQLWMLETLAIIVSDSWFTRSWITQELICSSDMVLLFEFDVSLNPAEALESASRGDVQISVKQLLNVIWWAMMPHNLALLAEMPEERNNILLVFWKLFPFTRPIPTGQLRNTCTFLSAWNFIQTTHNSRIADRLAIMGNLCNYPMRINSVEAETRSLNFSTCMITQALLNGDLEVLLHQPFLIADAIQKWPSSEEPNNTAFSLANNTDKSVQEVLAMDPTRAMRFASAMQAAMDHVPGYAVGAVSKVYDWASMWNAYIVNIGGSRGQVAMELAKNFGNIKLLVQDAAMTIEGAGKDVPEQVKERV
ncbi:hypothetical protein H634G_10987 [Metarhizium anisopliae BRIP 53293]|uniref:Heterokaryon incompatibility domain-containing protein n=1 Tax=Metarhizium anisopliae BRIP 53293 TaxID=1291518 RepID=A0A0D9NIM7_METAN|nr:hypothetical protein H634G_10987 [Metarhizium anisopliae BRIP 53293]